MSLPRSYRRAAWLDADFSGLVAACGAVPRSFIESGLGVSEAFEIELSNGRFAQLVWRRLQPQLVEVWLSYQGSFHSTDLVTIANQLGVAEQRFNKETGQLAWTDD